MTHTQAPILNCLKVVIALLLARASLIYSAPYATAGNDQNAISKLCDADRFALNQIIQGGDDPAALDRLLGGSSRLFDTKLFAPFQMMIVGGRNRSFEFLLLRISFTSDSRRNAAWSIFLKIALFKGNLEAAGFLLCQAGFQIDLSNRDNVWWTVNEGEAHEPWDLEGLKRLISSHPRHAAGLAPTYLDVVAAGSADEVLALIELALHCDADNAKLGNPGTFAASRFLKEGLLPSFISDADMAVAIGRLCELGAEPSLESFASLNRRLGGYPLSQQALRECELARECEAIGKVPEEEAGLIE
jgi:hypothetical protein